MSSNGFKQSPTSPNTRSLHSMYVTSPGTRLCIPIHAHLSPRPAHHRTQKNHCSITRTRHGKRKIPTTYSTSTMGSYDGAETCKLVGTYIFSLITPKFKGQVGLYRDDGLAVCKATPKHTEKTKQEVSEIFKSNGLKITIKANKKTINFLDVTLDLRSGSYKPFMKPNNKILYVHRQSNHPPTHATEEHPTQHQQTTNQHLI